MALKKDKEKVLGEVFDDDRIKTFLQLQSPAGVNRDYHLLEKAYRGMKAENFATFINFFVEAGHDINATNSGGKTILQIVQTHRHGQEYAESLQANGAK